MRSSRAQARALAAGALAAGALAALALPLAGCAPKGAPVCRPVLSWVAPVYGCAAVAETAAPRPLVVEDDPPPPMTPPTPTLRDLPAEPPLVTLNERSIDLAEKIQFQPGSPVLLPASEALLDQVATILFDHPEVMKIQIEGHTDSMGSTATNQKLSAARAQAVRAYLENAGVVGARMVAKGFGETHPIADNRTAAGRDQNRRVELMILERERRRR